jgi:predicted dehydrogenase
VAVSSPFCQRPVVNDPPVRYAIVGRGWRARFFLRLAALMPDRFAVVGVVTRSAAADLPDLVRRERPDFAITSVPWHVNPPLVESARIT